MKMKVLILLVVSFLVVNCEDVKKYLQTFGYYNPNTFDQSAETNAIIKFQNTFGLVPTGIADAATKNLIHTPRCGVSDHSHQGNAFSAGKWSKNGLTFYYNNYTPDLPQAEVRRLTIKALKFWSDVTPLTFTETSGSGDIVISFGRLRHHDGRKMCGYPFNGPSGVLAHAFFPPDGRLHFDDDEHYTTGVATGINYLWVATHELGHILGLEHDTQNTNAVMYPYYRPYNANMKLHSNDIYRIRSLYGNGGGVLPTNAPPPGCKDETTNCAQYVMRCQNYSKNWTTYMRKYCARTCNSC